MTDSYSIEISDDEAADEVRALFRWLRDENDLAGATVEWREPEQAPDEMGAVAAVVEVVLQPGGVVPVLITAIATWAATRRKKVKVKVSRGDRSVEVQAPDDADVDAIARAAADRLSSPPED